MSGTILLEQFDRPVPIPGSRDFSVVPDYGAEDLATDPGTDDQPEDTAREADDALLTDLDATGRLETLVSEIEIRWRSDVEREVSSVAKRTSQSISTMLPHLMTDFAASEIAASVVAIVEKAHLQDPSLLLSPEDHDAVVTRISELESALRIEVRKSTEQQPGTASLNWVHGGAELDLNEFLTTARQLLERERSPARNGEQET